MSTEIKLIIHPETPFDPAAGLPANLLSRFDTWRKSPPRSQFQQYGPLNAYLQGHKFSSESFLVKPQALLRCLATDIQIEAHNKHTRESEKGKSKGKKNPRYSIDSHGELVIKKRLYPDFDVDQYYSFPGDENLKCDIVRVVIEVGSLLKAKSLLDAQTVTVGNLIRYLKAVGNRAHGRLLGIGIAGNTACIVQISSDGWMKRGLDEVSTRKLFEWFSLFDPRLPKAIDDMVEFCKTDDPFGDSDESSFRVLGGLVTETGGDREEEEAEDPGYGYEDGYEDEAEDLHHRERDHGYSEDMDIEMDEQ